MKHGVLRNGHSGVLGTIKGKEIIAICVLLLVVVFHGVVNYRILSEDTTVFMYDEFGYYDLSIDSLKAIDKIVEQKFTSLAPIVNLVLQESYRPPLFYMIVGLKFYLHGNISMLHMIMTNIGFLFVLLLSMYLIGRKTGGIWCGLLAAFVLSMLPGAFAFTRVPMPTFLLMTFVALTYMCLLYSESFTKTRYAVLLGLSVGCGMLTKITYPAFVVLPILFALFTTRNVYCHEVQQRRSIAINLSLTITLASVISVWWYIAYAHDLTVEMPKQVFFDVSGNNIPFFYLVILCFQQLFPFFYIIFNTMIIVLLLKKKVGFVLKLIAYMVVPIVIISIASAEETRFTVAILPFVALLIACGLRELKNKMIITLVIAIALFQFVSLSFTPDSMFGIANNQFFGSINKRLNYRTRDNGLFHSSKEDWSTINKVYAVLKDDFAPNKGEVRDVYFMDNMSKLRFGLNYLSLMNKDVWFFNSYDDGVVWEASSDDLPIEKKKFMSSYYVMKYLGTNDTRYDPDEEKLFHYERWRLVRELFTQNKSDYTLLAEVESGENMIQIYKKNNIDIQPYG